MNVKNESTPKSKQAPVYGHVEERINVYTHAFGFLLSIAGLIILVMRASALGSIKHIFSFSVFGASLIFLYAASTLYHSAKHPKTRYILNILDHASIYVLIAGTYTPFALITLQNSGGINLFYVIWGIALAGIIFKVFFIGKFRLLSTVLYVAMGWLVVFDIKPLVNALPLWGLIWLFGGGIFYTLGAIIFGLDRLKYNHAIFHLFVLAGSFSHFVSIFYFVLPS